MRIAIDPHSGFCFGVTHAIQRAEEELRHGQLFCLGDIVHNDREVARLEQLGLQTIDYDALRELRKGRVLLRAHGEPPSTYRIARDNEIEIVDATCPVVKRLQDRIRTIYEQHPEGQIVIYGKKGHAEVIGLQGQTHNTAIVIERPEDVRTLDFTRPVYLFSQTTKSVETFHQIVAQIKAQIASDTTFEWHDTICRNVANRVEQIRLFATEYDIVFFVGGQKSSNAKVLFAHCKQANPNSYFISDPDEITTDRWNTWMEAARKEVSDMQVGICGATSTPLWLMEQVREHLNAVTLKFLNS